MRLLVLGCCEVLLLFAGVSASQDAAKNARDASRDTGRSSNVDTIVPLPVKRFCPPDSARIIEIQEADPRVDKQHHDDMRNLLVKSVGQPNTTILLGPNVVLDFSDASNDDIPLSFNSCVTLMSVSGFGPETRRRLALGLPLPSARTPHSLGPLLKFGPHRSDKEKVFFEIRSIEGFPPNDNVRISGFRLYGPSFDQQDVDDIGIQVNRSEKVEISNMEIAGWGGQGILVVDEGDDDHQPPDGPGQEPPTNEPGERIGPNSHIRVFRNYIHHNQHPRDTFHDHTAGYGVEISSGAWGEVFENLFDFNRHAIAAEGDTGGYQAFRNLTLKGGGVHYAPLGIHTHEFDIHGTGNKGKGGRAGVRFEYGNNAFQYRAGAAIYVRGRPQEGVKIHDNVFPHEGLENDRGDNAVKVEDQKDLDVIQLGPNNTINFDTYGHYGVGDFDGDSVDDLFLATGQSWWFSSFGEFPWSFLNGRTERLSDVKLGYFDNDLLCDVLVENDGEWKISSAGTGPLQSIGTFGTPLGQVVFGQFDPHVRDHRPGVTRRTTHAFRRLSNGQWQVTPLTAPAWQDVQSSSLPLNKLRFGDFTGDGVTDVLAVVGGHWSISESAIGTWRQINARLSDDVSGLFIADLDNNNIDDLIKLETASIRNGNLIEDLSTWWVSADGRSDWRKLKAYTQSHADFQPVLPTFAYAARFGVAPGGGILFIGQDRIGRFFSPGETKVGASPDWTSLFSY
jgi:hypothetical protein